MKIQASPASLLGFSKHFDQFCFDFHSESQISSRQLHVVDSWVMTKQAGQTQLFKAMKEPMGRKKKLEPDDKELSALFIETAERIKADD